MLSWSIDIHHPEHVFGATMKSSRRLFSIAILLASVFARADSLLVGTDFTTAQPSVVLCPGSECESIAQQFTLLSPVVIDDIQIAIGGPAHFGPNPDGSFSVGFTNQLGTETLIGSGVLPYTPNQSTAINEIVDFNNLDISLAAGTYYIEIAGSNVEMDLTQAVATSAGYWGEQFICDPETPFCNSPAGWGAEPTSPLAINISGTALTPEPSALVLLGTGIMALAGVRYLRGPART